MERESWKSERGFEGAVAEVAQLESALHIDDLALFTPLDVRRAGAVRGALR